MTNEELVVLIQSGKNEYMEELYISNKPFIYQIVKRFSYVTNVSDPYHNVAITEVDDLMNEAYFGLYRAVERFDSSKGVLFLSYASYWIKQSIKRYLENCGNVLHVPIKLQQKIYKYNQLTSYFLSNYNRVPIRNEYKYYLGINYKQLDHLEQFIHVGHVGSLDSAIQNDDDNTKCLGDTIKSSENIEEETTNELVKVELWNHICEVLKSDEAVSIIRLIYYENMSLYTVAKTIGKSREYVRKVQAVSLKRLRCNSKTKHFMYCFDDVSDS